MYASNVATALGIFSAIIGTIVFYVMVMPKKKDGNFYNPFLQFLHDFLHFKKLYVEEVIRFFYVLLTVFSICGGFFMLFGYVDYGFTEESTFVTGLIMMIAGPVIIRFVYGFMVMAILAVKNIIEINNKLPEKKKEQTPDAPQEESVN